jgi:uncharacterized protein (TIGR02246 family)
MTSTSTLNSDDHSIRALFAALWDGWNRMDAVTAAAPFADDAELVGFDGSEMQGRASIEETYRRIFSDHQTGRYIVKVRSIRWLAPGIAMLRAVAGVVPAGQTDLNPQLNSVMAMVAQKQNGEWRVVLLTNTPAQWHGRPDDVERLIQELRQLL